MRQARSTKAVRTIPKGAYECGTTSDELMNGDYRDSLHPGLDLQGNGYYSGSESARTDSAALKNSDTCLPLCPSLHLPQRCCRRGDSWTWVRRRAGNMAPIPTEPASLSVPAPFF